MSGVIKVPPELRDHLLENDDSLRVESDDFQDWVTPDFETVRRLRNFLRRPDVSKCRIDRRVGRVPMKHKKYGNGTRIGFESDGVFLHEDHRKRYFGVLRETASVTLQEAVPEAVAKFQGGEPASKSSQDLLGKLARAIPTVSDEVIGQVLKCTFAAADVNKNHKLSRTEVQTLMRKVLITMSAQQTREIMQEADTDEDGCISYVEFVNWLQSSAPQKVRDSLRDNLGTGPNIIKAAFRAWDRNGDGLVSDKEVKFLMITTCGLTRKQADLLGNLMDTDDDGKVDYDDFVKFVFRNMN